MHIHKENTKTKIAPNINVTWTPFQCALRLGVFLKLGWYFFLFPSEGQKISEGVRGSARPVSLEIRKLIS